MQPLQRYFERIPVEVVKKIATEFSEKEVVESGTGKDQTPDESISPQERWREMAQRVQEEKDPRKMIRLVRQLIATFEEDHQGKHHRLSGRAVTAMLWEKRGTPMKAGYPWQELYEAAILETEDAELPNRLLAAKAAIDARLQELQADHSGTSEERRAISDARSGLDALGRDLQARDHESGSSKA